VPRLLFFIDVWLFKGNNLFLVTVNVLIQFLHLLLLWHLIAQARLSGYARWAAAIAAGLLLLSAANIENFIWAFQTPFVLVFFAASAACVAVMRSSLAPRMAWLVLAIIMGFVATFSLANGVLVWPVLVFLTVIGGLGWRTTTVVTVAAIIISGLFLF